MRSLGDNVFKVYRSLLIDPDAFISRSTEALFSPLIADAPVGDGWANYLRDRYAFLALEPSPSLGEMTHELTGE